jgi:hypothetical protein
LERRPSFATLSKTPVPNPTASQTWLSTNPHKGVQVLTAVMLVLFITGVGRYLANSKGIVDPTGHAIGRDFVNLWTAARLVLEGHPATVFDVESFLQLERSLVGEQLPGHLWSYPPHFLFVVTPLGLFDYAVALALWSLIPAAIYAFAAGWPRRRNVLLLALAPATLVNVFFGQTGAFAAALLFAGLRLMYRRPALAGLCFGLLTVKPQLGLLLPVVLLLERKWRVIGFTILSAAALVLLSLAVFGPNLWQEYFRQNFVVTRHYLETGSGLFTVMAPSAFMAMRLYGAPVSTAYSVQLMTAFVALVGVVLAWRSRASLDQKVGLTGVAALLATPYAHNYDMTLVSLAVLSAAGGCQDEKKKAAPVFVDLIWVLPVVIMPLHTAGVVIAPWALLIFFGWRLALMRGWLSGGQSFSVSKSSSLPSAIARDEHGSDLVFVDEVEAGIKPEQRV